MNRDAEEPRPAAVPHVMVLEDGFGVDCFCGLGHDHDEGEEPDA